MVRLEALVLSVIVGVLGKGKVFEKVGYVIANLSIPLVEDFVMLKRSLESGERLCLNSCGHAAHLLYRQLDIGQAWQDWKQRCAHWCNTRKVNRARS